MPTLAQLDSGPQTDPDRHIRDHLNLLKMGNHLRETHPNECTFSELEFGPQLRESHVAVTASKENPRHPFDQARNHETREETTPTAACNAVMDNSL